MATLKEQLEDLAVLEELFLDQLTFKVSSLFDFLKLSPAHEREIESFMEELLDLSRETQKLLTGKDNA